MQRFRGSRASVHCANDLQDSGHLLIDIRGEDLECPTNLCQLALHLSHTTRQLVHFSLRRTPVVTQRLRVPSRGLGQRRSGGACRGKKGGVGSIETCEHSSDWERRECTIEKKRLFAIMPKWIAQKKGTRVLRVLSRD